MLDHVSSLDYNDSKMIVGGEETTADGGGLCQVTSTLYNAANFAGLDVIERSPHSSQLPYIGPGMDATVWWGGPGKRDDLDMKFRNTTDAYLLLREYVAEDGYVYAEIWGQKDGTKVSMRSRPSYVGTNGPDWIIYQTIEKNGKTVFDGVLHRDSYDPLVRRPRLPHSPARSSGCPRRPVASFARGDPSARKRRRNERGEAVARPPAQRVMDGPGKRRLLRVYLRDGRPVGKRFTGQAGSRIDEAGRANGEEEVATPGGAGCPLHRPGRQHLAEPHHVGPERSATVRADGLRFVPFILLNGNALGGTLRPHDVAVEFDDAGTSRPAV